jgi:Flp pilus assembly protein TadG
MNFAIAMYDYHLIDDAARSAARFAIVRGSASPVPATAADIQAFVDACGLKGATAKTTWTPNNAPGSTVAVEVRFDFQPIAPLVPSVVLPLASTAQMVISQ